MKICISGGHILTILNPFPFQILSFLPSLCTTLFTNQERFKQLLIWGVRGCRDRGKSVKQEK